MTECYMEEIEFVRCVKCGREESCYDHWSYKCNCSKIECTGNIKENK